MDFNICAYGCGNPASYFITKQKKPCCSSHQNKCVAIRTKNSNGLKQSYSKGRVKVWTDEHRLLSASIRREEVLKDLCSESKQYRSNNYLKKIIKEYNLLPYCCSSCGINKWKGEDLTLELDHVNGDAANNILSNLRLLCPNCHSLTPTFRGKSKNTGKIKVSDKDLIKAIKETNNIRQALIKVGLSPRGGNYTRATKLKHCIN